MGDHTELKRLAEAAKEACGDYIPLNDGGMTVHQLIGRIEACENTEPLCDAERTVFLAISRAERDQLKAENEALRKYGEEFAVLAERRREEVEALRKERDARHPFKPFHEPAIGFTGCVICGVYTDHGGLPCPKTRATADADMGKEERS